MALALGTSDLPLIDTPFGPIVDTAAARVPVLAWILNAAVGEDLAGLLDAVERGDELGTQYFRVERPDPDGDLSAAASRWAQASDEPLGDDVYVLTVPFLGDPEVVPRTRLEALLRDLVARRRSAPKPDPPWLFRPDPVAAGPAPEEEAMLRPLEAAAAATDAEPGVGDRPALLRRLEAAGLFDSQLSESRERFLELWDLPVLAGYVRAARALNDYLGSDERRSQLPDARPRPVVGAPISLDWFRSDASTPEGVASRDWLAFAEQTLRETPLPEEDATGVAFTRWGDRWVRVPWRRDDGRSPAALRADVG